MPAAKRTLTRIVLAGALARLVLWFWFQGEPLRIADALDYNELAESLVASGQFATARGEVTSIRPPLYPAMLAAIYSVAGVGPFQVVRAVQCLLALATVPLVYRLGADLYDRRTGLWAAGFFCFYPSLLAHNFLLLTETLFTFWLALACCALVRAFRSGRLGWVTLAGMALGLGALTRSILWLAPPLVAIYLLGFWQVSWSRRMAGTAMVLLIPLALVAPWSIRNTRLQRTFVAVDVMGGRNAMMGNYEYTPMRRAWDAISVEGDGAWYRVLSRAHPEMRGMTQGQIDKLALRHGIDFVKRHPGLTVRRDAMKFLAFWQLERSIVAGLGRGWFGAPPVPVVLAVTAMIFGSYALAMVAGIFGAVLVPPKNRAAGGILLCTIGFVSGIHTLVFGHERYHLPLMPLILVFAAAAVVHATLVVRRWRTARFVLATVLCLGLASSWIWAVLAEDFDRFMEILVS